MQVCADTIVGSHLVRGISGGQKKRVTTGEIVVGPVKVLLMDEISVRNWTPVARPFKCMLEMPCGCATG